MRALCFCLCLLLLPLTPPANSCKLCRVEGQWILRFCSRKVPADHVDSMDFTQIAAQFDREGVKDYLCFEVRLDFLQYAARRVAHNVAKRLATGRDPELAARIERHNKSLHSCLWEQYPRA